MYKRFEVKLQIPLRRKEFVNLIMKAKVSDEIKYCTMCLADGFITSDKQVNIDFTKNNNYKGLSKEIMSKSCKKYYSVALFEVCKLIAKKFYMEFDDEYDDEIENSTFILNCKLNDNYIFKLEREVIINNDYNMYRNVNFASLYTIIENKKLEENLLKDILMSKELIRSDCRAIYLGLKIFKII